MDLTSQHYQTGIEGAAQGTSRLTRVLFAVYLVVLVWILVFKLGVRFSYMENRSVNLIPFSAPARIHGQVEFSEMILNAIIFLPVGIYAASLFQRWSFLAKLFSCFCISFLCEAIQFIFRIGAFDVTDIIMNSFGGTIGVLTFMILKAILRDHLTAQKLVNMIALAGTILMIVLLVALKFGMLPIRYQ
ncbi:MAG: VanZ family protein [Ferruginibacter sp.]|nr:VanZ family protein [Ferruginibacter sp.]